MRFTLFVREELLFDYGIWNLQHVESCHTHTRSLFAITVKCLLDSGASGSLISAKFTKKLRVKQASTTHYSMVNTSWRNVYLNNGKRHVYYSGITGEEAN